MFSNFVPRMQDPDDLGVVDILISWFVSLGLALNLSSEQELFASRSWIFPKDKCYPDKSHIISSMADFDVVGHSVEVLGAVPY